MFMKNDTRRRIRPWLWGLAVFVAAAIATSYLLLAQWSDIKQTAPADVDGVFDAAVAEAGGGTPYIEIAAGGVVVVHREQEMKSPGVFETLTLLAWSPGDGRLLRVDYPRWFVQLKTSSSVDLGTMIAVVRKDWKHLNLHISYADLVKLGPALILDHQSESGARILLWTAGRGAARKAE